MPMKPSGAATCYMCDAPAVSREHTPPKCFFPEAKDVEDETDYRRNLVRVPACLEHNLTRSKDDEYTLVLVVTHYETSQVARQQFNTKIVRALRRSPAFTAQTFGGHAKVLLDGRETVAIPVDDERFERVMDNTCRGLYYHHTGGQKLRGAVRIHATAFCQTDREIAQAHAVLADSGRALFDSLDWHGQNPDAFFYQIHEDPTGEASILRMMFFSGFEVYALWGTKVDSVSAA